MLENLDAIGQREGEQDGFGGHRQREQVGGVGAGLQDATGAQHQNHGADQHTAVANQVQAGGKEALAHAQGGDDQGHGHAQDWRQGDDLCAGMGKAQRVDQDGRGIHHATQVEQAMGPAQVVGGGEQRLGKAHDQDRPQRRQGHPVQPEGHRLARPQVLKTVAAHAQDKAQGAAGGQYVPEVGAVAQADQDEQVVQHQGQNDAVQQAQAEVLGGSELLQVVPLPDFQRERITPRVVAAKVHNQRLFAQLRELEHLAPIGQVAPGGKGHLLATQALLPTALTIRQIQAQVEQGDAAILQPPLLRRVAAGRQADLDPPRIGAEADAGATGSGLETLLDVRAGHVLDAQLRADIFEQFDLAVEAAATAGRRQDDRRGSREGAAAEQAQAED